MNAKQHTQQEQIAGFVQWLADEVATVVTSKSAKKAQEQRITYIKGRIATFSAVTPQEYDTCMALAAQRKAKREYSVMTS